MKEADIIYKTKAALSFAARGGLDYQTRSKGGNLQ